MSPSVPAAAILAAALMLAAPPARADEPACPLDMFDAAAGTWSTMLADTVAACMADPACSGAPGAAGDAGAAGEPGAGDAGAVGEAGADGAVAEVPPPRLPPPRRPIPLGGPSGRFADAAATIGVSSDTRASAGQARTADAWLVGSGAANLGWRRGPKGCASGRGALGTDSQLESSVGVAFPWTFVAIALGGGQRWHVRPPLSSPRIWLRRAFIENHVQAHAAFGVWRHASGGVSAIAPVRMAISSRRQLDGPPEPGVSQKIAFSIYEHAGRATRVEVLRFAVDNYHPDGLPSEIMPEVTPRRPPIGVMRFDPLVLSVRGAGDHALDLELDAGFLSADEPLDCRGCAPVAGTLAIGATREDHTWQVRFDRDAYLAVDARIAVEDRLSLRHRQAVGRHTVRLDGFGAFTRTSAAGERGLVATGGVAAGFDAALPGGFALALDLEAGRSYYARLDGDQAPVAEPVARLGVALSRSFQSRRASPAAKRVAEPGL
jgi:hypothetical protein